MHGLFRKALQITKSEEGDFDTAIRQLRDIFGPALVDFSEFNREDVRNYPALSLQQRNHLLNSVKRLKLSDVVVLCFRPFYEEYELGMHTQKAQETLDEISYKFGLKTWYELTKKGNDNYRKTASANNPSAVLSDDFGNRDLTLVLDGGTFSILCDDENLEFMINSGIRQKELLRVEKAYLSLYQPRINVPNIGPLGKLQPVRRTDLPRSSIDN